MIKHIDPVSTTLKPHRTVTAVLKDAPLTRPRTRRSLLHDHTHIHQRMEEVIPEPFLANPHNLLKVNYEVLHDS